MIYEFPSVESDIRQGDIFTSLPRFDYSLEDLLILGEHDDEATSWERIAQGRTTPVTLAVAARPVDAIVITQDCDTIRAPQVTLCEIRPIAQVVGTLGTKASQFVANVKKQNRQNLKWFYLPPDERLFADKMAVDFQVTLSVPRADLERLRSWRRGRLNVEADEHFRERLSEYFRRYPVDEWYPLSKEEFEEYRKLDDSALPRPWQQ